VNLLEPALLARLEALQLGTRRPLAGFMSGEHRSRRHGTSLDFADYREYHPGDDFRRIDYHLYARLDVLLLKLYEAEEDLHLRLLVDTSASMGLSGKLETAQRVAAALGFVALTRRDPVSVHTFPLDRPAPRFLGRGAVPTFFQHLESLGATGTTDFAAAVSHLLARPGPPGLTVVLSDLLTPEWEPALSRLPARGSDVVIIHVLAPGELDPALSAPDEAVSGANPSKNDGFAPQTAPQGPLRRRFRPRDRRPRQKSRQKSLPFATGDVELVDRETRARVAVSVTSDVMARYRQVADAWLERVEQRCRQVGATYVRILTDESLEATLLTAWRRQGVLR
jgi:uncharacterized protein (DUF58 family)